MFAQPLPSPALASLWLALEGAVRAAEDALCLADAEYAGEQASDCATRIGELVGEDDETFLEADGLVARAMDAQRRHPG